MTARASKPKPPTCSRCETVEIINSGRAGRKLPKWRGGES